LIVNLTKNHLGIQGKHLQTSDINKIVDGQWQLNAYCQHQGRIIALMWVQKQNDDFYLDFALNLKTVVQNRLQMFALNAIMHSCHHFLPRITSFGKTHTHFLNIQI
jgi:hypothetical protein